MGGLDLLGWFGIWLDWLGLVGWLVKFIGLVRLGGLIGGLVG